MDLLVRTIIFPERLIRLVDAKCFEFRQTTRRAAERKSGRGQYATSEFRMRAGKEGNSPCSEIALQRKQTFSVFCNSQETGGESLHIENNPSTDFLQINNADKLTTTSPPISDGSLNQEGIDDEIIVEHTAQGHLEEHNSPNLLTESVSDVQHECSSTQTTILNEDDDNLNNNDTKSKLDRSENEFFQRTENESEQGTGQTEIETTIRNSNHLPDFSFGEISDVTYYEDRSILSEKPQKQSLGSSTSSLFRKCKICQIMKIEGPCSACRYHNTNKRLVNPLDGGVEPFNDEFVLVCRQCFTRGRLGPCKKHEGRYRGPVYGLQKPKFRI